jgi:RNA polymerase sigma-70 factor (ECF subfamily)
VAALALGMLRNRVDALDIVQDTFTKAFQSLDKFKGDSSFYTWIYRIGVNLWHRPPAT